MTSLWKLNLADLEPELLHDEPRADRLVIAALERELGQWAEKSKRPSAFSRSQLQKLFEEGNVSLNGVPIRSNAKLEARGEIAVSFPAPRSMELVPEDRPLEILFQDEHLLVLNKPPGLTVHPSETQREGTLVHALLHHIKDLSGIGGVLRPGIVHRLDKDTSGALVISKTDQAHHGLTKIFAAHDIERRYWALVYGSPTLSAANPATGELKIETLIGRNVTDRKKMSTEVKEGRRAVSFVKRIEEYAVARAKPFASWLEVRLETGRTHQVRVHLTGLGNSVMGDRVYGVPSLRHDKWLAVPTDVQKAIGRLSGQALHARVLGFTHPITGEALRFEAPLPEPFRLLQSALKNYL
jgi:23S rRNA pseudouridine1911/1915/1917 synthase